MTTSAPRRFSSPLRGPAAALLLRLRLATLGLATLGLATLGLTACAPATTRASISADALFMPGGQQLALICANQGRVARGGALVWNDGVAQESRPAPYLVSCRDYTLRNDGATLSVQDDTLGRALTHFDPDANFLVYFADLFVTFPSNGLLGADPTSSVPDVLEDTLRGVSVTVRQGGSPDAALLAGGAVTAVRYDPSRPVTLYLKATRSPVEWPEVTIEANKGLITAPIYR